MKELIVKISKDGSEVNIEANGFVDGSCGDIERKVLAAIGTQAGGGKKPEFYGSVVAGSNIGG